MEKMECVIKKESCKIGAGLFGAEKKKKKYSWGI